MGWKTAERSSGFTSWSKNCASSLPETFTALGAPERLFEGGASVGGRSTKKRIPFVR